MKKLFRIAGMLFAGMLAACACGCTIADSGKDPDKDIKPAEPDRDYSEFATPLLIEGGGQDLSYCSTESLVYDKYTNPYPYNTLEKLANEWNERNAEKYGYYFKIAQNSINNDRETLVPMLNNGTAPEIVFYLPGVTIAEDQSKGWFYDLKDVMEKPNVYCKEGEAGSTRWRDLYRDDMYSSFFAPNGQLFTVSMELDPIGILYNKTVLDKAGVTKIPETYKEFMEAQEKIRALGISEGRGDPEDDTKYLTPFYSYYPWYDSCIEMQIFGEKMDYLDVINPNGYVDAEELVRGYLTKDENGEPYYSVDSDRMVEVYRLVNQACQYYPKNYTSYYTEQQFAAGNIAMLEVSGAIMRTLIDTVEGQFDVAVGSFPLVETQPAGEEESPYYTKYDTSKYIRRGMRGDSTSWAITNSAMNRDAKNGDTKCVDACIDMLMWLTMEENNERMVNELGFAVPISGKTDYEYFKPLAELYRGDSKNANSYTWAALNSAGRMNKDFYDASYLFRRDNTFKLGTDLTAIKRELTARLLPSFQASANTLYTQNKWDRDAWPAAGVTSKK